MNDSSSPTVWMNVTTSFNWKRPAVGVVRVETELAKSLRSLLGDRLRFCIWDGSRFVALTAPYPPTPSKPTDQPAESKIAPAPLFETTNKKQALLNIAKGLYSLTPIRFRPWMDRLLRALKPRVHRTLATFRSIIKKSSLLNPSRESNHSKALPPKNSTESIFKPNETLISVGLDWDHGFYKTFFDLKKRENIKIVTCCYDLIPVLYPQYCVGNVAATFGTYFIELAWASDLALCISKNTEKDLIQFLQSTASPVPKTLVIPLGDSVPTQSNGEPSAEIQELCSEKFILFVSTIERRKNHEVLYRAYRILCERGHQGELPKLVFVGMQGWGVGDLLKDIELDPLVSSLIVRLTKVSDAELGQLYKNALFCVYPSFYEGWGLPVAEAMTMEKPTLCSNKGSLPEVAGDLVSYADPYNATEWADMIWAKLGNPEALEFEVERIRGGYKHRRWVDAAELVLSNL